MKLPGTRVRLPDGTVAYVEEFDHAYLVRGYGIKWGITPQQAQRAVFEFLGRKKWTRIIAMPYRPLWTEEIGDDIPTAAVAFYFDIGWACNCHDREREFKP